MNEQKNENSLELKELAPAWNLFKKSLEMYQQKFKKIISISLVPVLAMVVLMLFFGTLALLKLNFDIIRANMLLLVFVVIVSVLITILIIYLSVISQVGVKLLLKKFEEDKGVLDLLKEAHLYFWKYLWVTILKGFILLGLTLLFIVPGIIFAVFYLFAEWVVVLEEKKGIEAIKRSKELTGGYWWNIAGKILYLLIFYFVFTIIISVPNFFLKDGSLAIQIWGIFTQVINFLVAPIPVIYFYLIYKELKNIKG